MEADELLREYKKSLKENKQHEINEVRRQIVEKAAEETVTPIVAAGESVAGSGKRLAAGDRVVVAGLNKQGVVVTPPDAGGEAFISVGSIKMKVHISQLYEDVTPQVKKPEKTALRVNKASDIRTEVDLRGCSVEEGLEVCDKYLDDAYLANLNKVTIIHGKGTGVLRSAVQQFLKGHPRVKGFRFGAYGEGGDGVTVAELKS
jgi:DNA mismatch repair protein MutS2